MAEVQKIKLKDEVTFDIDTDADTRLLYKCFMTISKMNAKVKANSNSYIGENEWIGMLTLLFRAKRGDL